MTTPSQMNVCEEILQRAPIVALSEDHCFPEPGWARALIDAAPERCVWASDWPHPVSRKQPPNDADLLELLYRYVRDEGELQRILVDNPSTLFGYGN